MSWMVSTKASVSIERCDNGYILTWSRPAREDRVHADLGLKQKTSGKEVYTKLKDALDEAKRVLS